MDDGAIQVLRTAVSRSKIDLAAVSRSKFRPLITLRIFEGWRNGWEWTMVLCRLSGGCEP